MDWLIVFGLVFLTIKISVLFVRKMYKVGVFSSENPQVVNWIGNLIALLYTVTGAELGKEQRLTIKALAKLGKIKIYGRNARGHTLLLFKSKKKEHPALVTVTYYGHWYLKPLEDSYSIFEKYLERIGLGHREDNVVSLGYFDGLREEIMKAAETKETTRLLEKMFAEEETSF